MENGTLSISNFESASTPAKTSCVQQKCFEKLTLEYDTIYAGNYNKFDLQGLMQQQ